MSSLDIPLFNMSCFPVEGRGILVLGGTTVNSAAMNKTVRDQFYKTLVFQPKAFQINFYPQILDTQKSIYRVVLFFIKGHNYKLNRAN
jgi:hypothetical protein